MYVHPYLKNGSLGPHEFPPDGISIALTVFIGLVVVINAQKVIRPHRNAQHKMRPIATHVTWSVCISVFVGHKRELCKN